MSSKDKDRDKDRDKKHKKSSSSSSSSSSKSSSSSDSKRKKSSSHKSSSSRATHNTRRDTPNDEYNEETDDLQSIEEVSQEYTEPPYDGNRNVVGATQGYSLPVGYTHARPVRPDLLSRLEPSVSYAVAPGRPSQTQNTYTDPVNYGQSTSTEQASSRAIGSYQTSSPYYTQSGALPQAQQVSYNSQTSYAQTTSAQQSSGRPEAAGNLYSSPGYSTQRNPAETGSEFPATSDLATAIEEVAAYTHAPQNSPPTGPASMPRGEPRTRPWQDPSMEQNLHHGPLEPWNENPAEEGTLYDDTNRVKREDDITGS